MDTADARNVDRLRLCSALLLDMDGTLVDSHAASGALTVTVGGLSGGDIDCPDLRELLRLLQPNVLAGQ